MRRLHGRNPRAGHGKSARKGKDRIWRRTGIYRTARDRFGHSAMELPRAGVYIRVGAVKYNG